MQAQSRAYHCRQQGRPCSVLFWSQAEEEAERQEQLRRTVEKLAAADPNSQRPPQPGSDAGDMEMDNRDDDTTAGLGLSGEEAFARRARCCAA